MRDFFSLAKIIAAPGDPSILDMCLQKADKGKGAAEVWVKNNRKSSGFWKLKQKKSMRLNIGSECHLVGEEVAQGGASTSFSPLCSEGGLQIQIKAHTNTVQRNYQLTHIHVHTDHTNTQKHKNRKFWRGSCTRWCINQPASFSPPLCRGIARSHKCKYKAHTNTHTIGLHF